MPEMRQKSTSRINSKGEIVLSYYEVIFVKKALFCNIANTLANMSLAYLLPALSTHMVRDAPIMNPALFGVMMVFSAFAYAGQNPVTQKLLKKKSRRTIISMGWVIFSSALLMGLLDPGSRFNIAGKAVFLCVLMILYGWGLGMTLTPIVPEIQESITAYYGAKGVKFDKDQMLNYSSGFYVSFNAMGYCLGPATSSQLMNIYIFQGVVMIMLGICVYFIVIYITVCGLNDSEEEISF